MEEGRENPLSPNPLLLPFSKGENRFFKGGIKRGFVVRGFILARKAILKGRTTGRKRE